MRFLQLVVSSKPLKIKKKRSKTFTKPGDLLLHNSLKMSRKHRYLEAKYRRKEEIKTNMRYNER